MDAPWLGSILRLCMALDTKFWRFDIWVGRCLLALDVDSEGVKLFGEAAKFHRHLLKL